MKTSIRTELKKIVTLTEGQLVDYAKENFSVDLSGKNTREMILSIQDLLKGRVLPTKLPPTLEQQALSILGKFNTNNSNIKSKVNSLLLQGKTEGEIISYLKSSAYYSMRVA